MYQRDIKSLGAPAVKICGLQIWVHGRQFANASDYWDGNWLNGTVHCGASGALVFAEGPILHLSELAVWRNEINRLNDNLTGVAGLKPIEPYIEVFLKAGSLGHLGMEVSITPDHLTQKHLFEFDIDQSYLVPLMKQVDALLKEHPIRDSKSVPTQ